LRKVGAVQEAILRNAFLCQGQYIDQVLWSIVESDWRQTKTNWSSRTRIH
jgi:RimJ/RimL family protein N-acetyltransferase